MHEVSGCTAVFAEERNTVVLRCDLQRRFGRWCEVQSVRASFNGQLPQVEGEVRNCFD